MVPQPCRHQWKHFPRCTPLQWLFQVCRVFVTFFFFFCRLHFTYWLKSRMFPEVGDCFAFLDNIVLISTKRFGNCRFILAKYLKIRDGPLVTLFRSWASESVCPRDSVSDPVSIYALRVWLVL